MQSNDMDTMVITFNETKQNQQPDRVECITGEEISLLFLPELPLWGLSSHQAPPHITYLWEECKSCRIKCAMEKECIAAVVNMHDMIYLSPFFVNTRWSSSSYSP